MTTRVRLHSVPDLFVPNAVMNLGGGGFVSAPHPAGAFWFTDSSNLGEPLRSVLEMVLDLVEKKQPQLELWLLAGSSAWQPNTRVVRYHKLWGAWKARSLHIPLKPNLHEEVTIESDGKLKFFGAIKLSALAIDDLLRILLSESCVYLAALPEAMPPQFLLREGWSGDLVNDVKLVIGVTEAQAILFKKLGDFDDEERGLVAIGNPALVQALLN